jgi:hypothetical protein
MVFGSKDFNVFEDRAVRAISESSRILLVLARFAALNASSVRQSVRKNNQGCA